MLENIIKHSCKYIGGDGGGGGGVGVGLVQITTIFLV